MIENEKRILMIQPQDPEMHAKIKAVDQTCKVVMRTRHEIYENLPFLHNTIACVHFEVLVKILAEDVKNTGIGNKELNFYDLIIMTITNKKNNEAEKEGNLNIVFHPGPVAIELTKSTIEIEEEQYISPEAKFGMCESDLETEFFLKADMTSNRLLTTRYGKIHAGHWRITAVAYTFIECLIKEMVARLKQSPKETITVNFNDVMEFHVFYSFKQEIVIRISPGLDSKLIAKSDETTEYEDDDLEEE